MKTKAYGTNFSGKKTRKIPLVKSVCLFLDHNKANSSPESGEFSLHRVSLLFLLCSILLLVSKTKALELALQSHPKILFCNYLCGLSQRERAKLKPNGDVLIHFCQLFKGYRPLKLQLFWMNSKSQWKDVEAPRHKQSLKPVMIGWLGVETTLHSAW